MIKNCNLQSYFLLLSDNYLVLSNKINLNYREDVSDDLAVLLIRAKKYKKKKKKKEEGAKVIKE